jgi:hypothetical protein
MMTCSSIAPVSIQQLGDRTVLDMDTSGEGLISFADFYTCLTQKRVLFDSLIDKLSLWKEQCWHDLS